MSLHTFCCEQKDGKAYLFCWFNDDIPEAIVLKGPRGEQKSFSLRGIEDGPGWIVFVEDPNVGKEEP